MTNPPESAFKEPDPANGAAWIGHSQFFDRRIVSLVGPLDDRLAGEVCGQLMTLDALGDEGVWLHVDSPGGPLSAAFSVIDTMQALGVPARVVCRGRAEGTAAAVVAAGERRYAAAHARFRLAEPETTVLGPASTVAAWAEQQRGQVDQFIRLLASSTGRAVEHVEADVAVGRWLDASEAISYGLVDELWGRPGGRSGPGPERPPLGFGSWPPR